MESDKCERWGEKVMMDTENLRKQEGSCEEGPEMTEICEQGTLLLCCPKDVWASRKKKIFTK